MPKIRSTSALVLVLFARVAFRMTAQTSHGLVEEMTRLKVHTALMVPSQEIDDAPVWSPDGHYLAFDAAGKWYKLELEKIALVEAKWHGAQVGVVQGKPQVSAILPNEVDAWRKSQLHGEGEVSAKSGLTVKFKRHELSSSLTLSRGKQTFQLWQTEMENCGELAISPSERFVAYICELNGIFVTDLEGAWQVAELGPQKAK